MFQYTLKRETNNLKIIERGSESSFNLNSKQTTYPNCIEITSLHLYDSELIIFTIEKQLRYHCTRIGKIVKDILDNPDENNRSDIRMALNEIERLKNQITIKFDSYLSELKKQEYLNQLQKFESKLQENS